MYKNSEGYPDPTAGTAISHIRLEEKINSRKEPYLQWVYIASPFRGDIEKNTNRAIRYTRFVARQCCVPICPFSTSHVHDTN